MDGITYLKSDIIDSADSIHDFRFGYRNAPTPNIIKQRIHNTLRAQYIKDAEPTGEIYSDRKFLAMLGLSYDSKILGKVDGFEINIFNAIIPTLIPEIGRIPLPKLTINDLSTLDPSKNAIVIDNITSNTITKLGPIQLKNVQEFIYNYLFSDLSQDSDVYFAFDATAANVGKIMSGRERIFNLITPQTIADPAKSQSKVTGSSFYYFPVDREGGNVFTAGQNSFTRDINTIQYINSSFSEVNPYGFIQSIRSNVPSVEIGKIEYAGIGNKLSGPSVDELINVMMDKGTTRITTSNLAPFMDNNGALLYDLKRLGDHEQVRAVINFKHEGAGHNVVFATKDKVCAVFAVMNGIATMVESENNIYLFRERPVTTKITVTAAEFATLQSEKEIAMKAAYNQIHRIFIGDMVNPAKVEQIHAALEQLKGYTTTIPDSLAKYTHRIGEVLAIKGKESITIIDMIHETLTKMKDGYIANKAAIDKAVAEADISTEYDIYSSIDTSITEFVGDSVATTILQTMIYKYAIVSDLIENIAPSAVTAGEEEADAKNKAESIQALYTLFFRFNIQTLYDAVDALDSIREEIVGDIGPRGGRYDELFNKYKAAIELSIREIGIVIRSLFYNTEVYFKDINILYSNLVSCIRNERVINVKGKLPSVALDMIKGQLLNMIDKFATQTVVDAGCPTIPSQFGGYIQTGGDPENSHRDMNANDIYFVREICSMAERYLTPLLVQIIPKLGIYSLMASYNNAKKVYSDNITLTTTLQQQIVTALSTTPVRIPNDIGPKGEILHMDDLKTEILSDIGGAHPIDWYISKFPAESLEDIRQISLDILQTWKEYIIDVGLAPTFLSTHFDSYFTSIVSGDIASLRSMFTLSIMYHLIDHSWNRSIYTAMGIVNTGRRNLDLLNTGNIDNVFLLLRNIDGRINEPRSLTYHNFTVATGGRRTRRRRRMAAKRKTRQRR